MSSCLFFSMCAIMIKAAEMLDAAAAAEEQAAI